MSEAKSGLTPAELYEMATRIERDLIANGDPLSGADWEVMQVVRAWLVEHSADDGETVTPRWLQSIGFRNPSIAASACWDSPDPNERVRLRTNENRVWVCGGNHETVVLTSPTRGEIRRLCAALRIELTTPAPG